jgi:site-specific recombinase XerD
MSKRVCLSPNFAARLPNRALGIPSTEAIPNLPAPLLIAGAGEQAKERYFEFFAAQIRNRNTRAAYLQAAHQFFGWCETLRLTLAQIRPLHVAAYVEGRQRDLRAPSIKQHLAGLRMLFNWLVTGQVLPSNPALFVKGPRFSRQTGVTPVLEAYGVAPLS